MTSTDVSPHLSAEDIASYRRNGWLRVNGLMPPAEAEALIGQVPGVAPTEAMTGSGSVRYDDDDVYKRRHRLHSYAEAFSDDYRNFILSSRLAGIARDLLGARAVRHLHSKVMEKVPESKGGLDTMLHQDYPFMPLDRSASLLIWVALTDMPAEMGTLQFAEGSHRAGSLGRDPTLGRENDAVRRAVEREGWTFSEPPDLRAGDATIHADLTVHCAPPNRTDRSRWALSICYMDADCLYTGAESHATDGLGLVVNQPFDHERFPIVA